MLFKLFWQVIGDQHFFFSGEELVQQIGNVEESPDNFLLYYFFYDTFLNLFAYLLTVFSLAFHYFSSFFSGEELVRQIGNVSESADNSLLVVKTSANALEGSLGGVRRLTMSAGDIEGEVALKCHISNQ